MKLLLAAPDRDFLLSYEKLLTLSGHDVVTSFDGTHVIKLIADGGIDLAVIDENIPRIEAAKIVGLLKESGVPAIVLLSRKVSTKLLLSDCCANAFLTFPFLPDELCELIEKVADKFAHGGRTEIYGTEIDFSKFLLGGRLPLANGELDVLLSLINGTKITTRHSGVYINSLNNKFALLRKNARIEYLANLGYRLVDHDE